MDTPAATPPTTNIQAPGAPVHISGQSELPPTPDPRDLAVSSRLPHIPTAVVSSSKLSTITAALGYNRFHDNTFAQSSYVPSFLLMSLVLSHIDRIMLNTYRFGQSNPDWHPVMSQIYYGIVFIVHILNVRKAAQVISMSEFDFLNWFETVFPLTSLPVAGPLKHFLQAITVAAGPNKFWGNIYPHTPTDWILRSADSRFQFDESVFNVHLPPVRLLVDFLSRAITMHNVPNFDVTDAQHWNRFFLPFDNVHSIAIPDERIFGLPGMTDLVYLPATQMPSWYEAASGIPFPPRLLAAAGDTISVAECCGFANYGDPHYSWFPVIISMMQRHAQFFKDSTSLSSIGAVGLGACIPTIRFRPNANISLANAAAAGVIKPVDAVAAAAAAQGAPATPGHGAGFVATPFQSLRVTALSKANDLHLLAEQFSLLSAVNVEYYVHPIRGNHYDPLPANADVRAGPFWNLPDVKSHAEIDVLTQIKSFLTGTFHVDQRMTR